MTPDSDLYKAGLDAGYRKALLDVIDTLKKRMDDNEMHMRISMSNEALSPEIRKADTAYYRHKFEESENAWSTVQIMLKDSCEKKR